jgi:hypothetical protein
MALPCSLVSSSIEEHYDRTIALEVGPGSPRTPVPGDDVYERTVALEVGRGSPFSPLRCGLSDDESAADDDGCSTASSRKATQQHTPESPSGRTSSAQRRTPPRRTPESPRRRTPRRPLESSRRPSTPLERFGAHVVGGALCAAAALLPSPRAAPARRAPGLSPVEFRPEDPPLRTVLADLSRKLNISAGPMADKLERLGAKTLTDMDYLTDGEFGELGLSPDKEAVVRGHLRSLARR